MATLIFDVHGPRIFIRARLLYPIDPSPRLSWIDFKIDTGSTHTAIPRAMLEAFERTGRRLKRLPDARTTLASGEERRLPRLVARLEVADVRNQQWRSDLDLRQGHNGFFICDKPHGLIGMDILSLWKISFDGPNGVATAELS